MSRIIPINHWLNLKVIVYYHNDYYWSIGTNTYTCIPTFLIRLVMKGIIKWNSVKQNDYDHYGQFIDFWNVISNSVEIKLHKIISWKSSVIISVQHADTTNLRTTTRELTLNIHYKWRVLERENIMNLCFPMNLFPGNLFLLK
jgi:hypothetical protein